MPAIWPSSERPMSVRTVWVNGIRHAILSPDDPLGDSKLRQCPTSSKGKSYSAKLQKPESKLDHLSSCFMNLNAVEKNYNESNKSTMVLRRLSAPPWSRTMTKTPENPLEFSTSKDFRIVERDRRKLTGKQNTIEVLIDETAIKNEISGRKMLDSTRSCTSNLTEFKQVEESFETQWNPLSERVLQWLDLSGKSHDYDYEDVIEESVRFEEERKWTPMQRKDTRLKRETYLGKEHVMIQDYKLLKERKQEFMERGEKSILGRSLPDIKQTKDEKYSEDNGNENMKVKGDVDKYKSNEKISTIWSPPGRLQLHVIMPNFRIKNKHTSSQESLI